MQRKTVKKRNSNENLAIATSFSFGDSFADYAGNGKQFPLGYVTVETKASIPNNRNIQAVTSVDLSQVFANISAKTNRIEKEKTKQEFDVLVKEWKEATAHFSSERQQTAHLSFLKIAVLGEKALPLVLDEFRREPIPGWLSILEAFAGKDVALNATTYKEAIECWVNWGKDKGHLKS